MAANGHFLLSTGIKVGEKSVPLCQRCDNTVGSAHPSLSLSSCAPFPLFRLCVSVSVYTEMFPHTPRYLVHRSHNQWGSESQNWKRHWTVWRSPDFSEKTQTEVVRACHTIIWTSQDFHTGNSTRRETKRQTEETMGRQHQRVGWPWMEYHATESRESQGVEEAGCKNYSGAQRSARQRDR